METCQPEWFKSYLEWWLDNGQISKRSTLQTHWKFLRLGYARKHGSMAADVSIELTTVRNPFGTHYLYAEMGLSY